MYRIWNRKRSGISYCYFLYFVTFLTQILQICNFQSARVFKFRTITGSIWPLFFYIHLSYTSCLCIHIRFDIIYGRASVLPVLYLAKPRCFWLLPAEPWFFQPLLGRARLLPTYYPVGPQCFRRSLWPSLGTCSISLLNNVIICLSSVLKTIYVYSPFVLTAL